MARFLVNPGSVVSRDPSVHQQERRGDGAIGLFGGRGGEVVRVWGRRGGEECCARCLGGGW